MQIKMDWKTVVRRFRSFGFPRLRIRASILVQLALYILLQKYARNSAMQDQNLWERLKQIHSRRGRRAFPSDIPTGQLSAQIASQTSPAENGLYGYLLAPRIFLSEC